MKRLIKSTQSMRTCAQKDWQKLLKEWGKGQNNIGFTNLFSVLLSYFPYKRV